MAEIQLDETRAKNAVRWWKYAKECEAKQDDYGAFFAIWIAFIILAKDYQVTYCSHLRRTYGDQQAVECCFSHAQELILEAIRDTSLSENRGRLSARYDGAILRSDTLTPTTRGHLTDLARVWQSNQIDDGRESRGVRDLLLQVRNGLFHGTKMYNDDTSNREDDDRRLLRDLNPIAFAIVTRILNQPGPHQHLLP
jgi:hypothetical protein